MTLSEDLAQESRAASDLAKAIGVTTSTITRLARGDRKNPSLSLALKIERETKGLVSAKDLEPVNAGAPE
jgi:transcriptional regulator with XRE-family HTH domain